MYRSIFCTAIILHMITKIMFYCVNSKISRKLLIFTIRYDIIKKY